LALTNTYLDIQEMVTQYPETVRAAYYLSQIHDEPLRREAEKALVSRQISGDAVPAYLQKLQEAKEHQEQRQSSPGQKVEEEEKQLPQSSPRRSLETRDSSMPSEAQTLPSFPSQPSRVRESVLVSASAKDENRLERELSYLQGYANRLKQRPRSMEERRILKEIRKVIEQMDEADPLPDSTPTA
jgi:hypothetical protein